MLCLYRAPYRTRPWVTGARASCFLNTAAMNRPRNRQPRLQRQQDQNGSSPRDRPGPQKQTVVPNIHQVVSGAKVCIVLKQDQATGQEVRGTVLDVLTRGNHPHGIKVRLTDGRVGRVQRMTPATTSQSQELGTTDGSVGRRTRDDNPNVPPPRTLVDFLSPELRGNTADSHGPQGGDTAKCPICGEFEGDEIAVSRHVDEHLT